MDELPLHARERFLDALRSGDPSQIESVLADDFTFVDRESSVVGRDELIALLASGDIRFETIRVIDDSTCEVGDGEVRFRTRVHLSGRRGTRRYDGEYRLLEVYRRRGERWQAVLSSAWLAE